MDELAVLQIISMKGRVTVESLGGILGVDSAAVTPVVDELMQRELVEQTATGLRIALAGRERCNELVSQENASADAEAVGAVYREFSCYNDELKKIITDWQLRDANTPNDHSDPDYDEQILARLHDLHERVLPLADAIAQIAPRLGHYRNRLSAADHAITAGDHSFVSRPLIDSYHTVWFELHDDLMGLAGRNRADEARAGRSG